MPFAHSKCQGEWVELLFAAECLHRGISPAKPYGDSTPYDFIVDSHPYPKTYGAANGRRARQTVGALGGRLKMKSGESVQSVASSSAQLKRVQVKSVSAPSKVDRAYHIASMRSVASSKKPYHIGDFDFLAAYIIPRQLWYIVPIAEVAGIMMLAFAPGRRRRRLEKYRSAWHLLKCA